MRLGRISFDFGYVVDLDNPDMVAHAKDAVIEDLAQVVFQKGGSEAVEAAIDVKEDNTLTEADIPEFLKDAVDEEVAA